MSKVTPMLWFNGQTEDAMKLYTSLFDNSRIVAMDRFPEGMPRLGGKVMHGVFELDGKEFKAFDGGPEFTLNESYSMFVTCKDQEEVDRYWDALTADGGEESQCGWLKDKFGVSWQIIPKQLEECLGGADQAGAGRAMQAMMEMKKLIVADLQAAYKG